MIGADTNVIVRYLTKDIEEQALKVKELLKRGEKLYINESVLTELYWVLTNVYDYPKLRFIEAIGQLTNTEGFEFFDEAVINDTIADFINSSAGFHDCLNHQLNNNQNLQTLTFDRKAFKLKGMRLLE